MGVCINSIWRCVRPIGKWGVGDCYIVAGGTSLGGMTTWYGFEHEDISDTEVHIYYGNNISDEDLLGNFVRVRDKEKELRPTFIDVNNERSEYHFVNSIIMDTGDELVDCAFDFSNYFGLYPAGLQYIVATALVNRQTGILYYDWYTKSVIDEHDAYLKMMGSDFDIVSVDFDKMVFVGHEG